MAKRVAPTMMAAFLVLLALLLQPTRGHGDCSPCRQQARANTLPSTHRLFLRRFPSTSLWHWPLSVAWLQHFGLSTLDHSFDLSQGQLYNFDSSEVLENNCATHSRCCNHQLGVEKDSEKRLSQTPDNKLWYDRGHTLKDAQDLWNKWQAEFDQPDVWFDASSSPTPNTEREDDLKLWQEQLERKEQEQERLAHEQRLQHKQLEQLKHEQKRQKQLHRERKEQLEREQQQQQIQYEWRRQREMELEKQNQLKLQQDRERELRKQDQARRYSGQEHSGHEHMYRPKNVNFHTESRNRIYRPPRVEIPSHTPRVQLASLQVAKGYLPRDISVQTEGALVKVQGKQVCGCEETCVMKEFERSFSLPQGTDPKSLTASFNDGLLVVEGDTNFDTRHFTDTRIQVAHRGVSSDYEDLKEKLDCLKEKSGIKLSKINKGTGKAYVEEDYRNIESGQHYEPAHDDDHDGVTIEVVEE